MSKPCKQSLPRAIRAATLLSLLASAPASWAYEFYAQGDTQLSADFEAAFGVFHSDESYAQSGTLGEGSAAWQEAYFKYGLSGSQGFSAAGDQLYGKLNWVSSATFGDGDAAGWSNGSERTTKVEDAYLGWRSGQRFAALGDNGVDVSFGRQNIVIGDGFLVSGDALNLGDEIADGMLDRGGAYYLTARKAFDRTAVLRLGGEQGLRGDLMWLKSDNRAQGKAEMAVATLEQVTDKGTVGLTYLDVLDTDEEFDFVGRKGIRTYSLRGQGSAGVDNLFLAGEYAHQNRHGDAENAWYLEAGWTFAELPWSPSVNYRYSRFSESYDPLFYGNGRALGTWFQGEVASNYAGPFNNNTQVHHVGIKASPLENLSVGALLYDFDTLETDNRLNLDGRELNLYAEWGVSEHLFVMPVLGFYQPEADASNGGTQLGNDDTNVYAQLIMATMF
ncbi:MAG: alginate export family protein [Pseudomonas sp.]|nr:alginate export family protein [Pseudomonas sp.]